MKYQIKICPLSKLLINVIKNNENTIYIMPNMVYIMSFILVFILLIITCKKPNDNIIGSIKISMGAIPKIYVKQ